MRLLTQSVLIATLAVWVVGLTVVKANEVSGGCLHGVTQGSEATPVLACPDSDPLHLADNADIQKAMKMLGINSSSVQFKGCEKLSFSASPIGGSVPHTYVVSYPTEVKEKFLAPILHELSHVMQMEASGGLTQLRNEYKSKRIELAADYLTGVMFSKIFPQAALKEFEQNILLVGLYVEPDVNAHGTPAQRGQAFRRGVFGSSDKIDDDMRNVSLNFQRNIYGHIL
ncbi:hypothetical protein PS903_03023 [Pseudomonas fluorescens]|nr:hypothetical protein PS903_03023 [Pseudomonas fluorescens]